MTNNPEGKENKGVYAESSRIQRNKKASNNDTALRTHTNHKALSRNSQVL